MKKFDKKWPINMELSISSIQEAVRYWLSHVVFKEKTKIVEVVFLNNDNVFRVVIDRTKRAQDEQ